MKLISVTTIKFWDETPRKRNASLAEKLLKVKLQHSDWTHVSHPEEWFWIIVYEEAHMDNELSPVFKLAELVQLYKSRMKHRGVKHDSRVHMTHLKRRLLAYFPNMSTVPGVQYPACIAMGCKLDRDFDAVYPTQIVRYHIIRDAHMFNEFPAKCQ